MDSSFPSYKGFLLKGRRKSEETYNDKKFNNHVIIRILSGQQAISFACLGAQVEREHCLCLNA